MLSVTAGSLGADAVGRVRHRGKLAVCDAEVAGALAGEFEHGCKCEGKGLVC